MWAPPEITTGRLMAGAGAGPMLAASQSFTAFAYAFETAIDSLLTHLGRLMGSWQGPAAEMVAATLTRHIALLRLLHAQLVTTAARTADQAAAYTTAATSVIPIPAIVVNKVTRVVLVATNFFGQNQPIITVKEVEYAVMGFHNMAVQAAYLAATVANTTFEPFQPPAPLVSTDVAVPSIANQSMAAATSAADNLRLKAIAAEASADQAAMQAGQGAGLTYAAAQEAATTSEQADAEAAMARFREAQLRQLEQMGQQAAQQIAPIVVQQAIQLQQQVGQQVLQAGQQVGQQISSHVASLMEGVNAPDLGDVGFFDTRPDSPTLDVLAGTGTGSSAMVAGLHVSGLGGLSGASTGYRFPASWDAALAASAPPPSSAAASAAGAARPIGPAIAPMAGTQQSRDQAAPLTRPVTEVIPVWGEQDTSVETVSVGELTRERQEAS
ncbi:PPE family protein [Mycobacterium sp. LTG2003]